MFRKLKTTCLCKTKIKPWVILCSVLGESDDQYSWVLCHQIHDNKITNVFYEACYLYMDIALIKESHKLSGMTWMGMSPKESGIWTLGL